MYSLVYHFHQYKQFNLIKFKRSNIQQNHYNKIKMQSRSSHSSLQKNFQTQTTFKRNARYYNAPEILENQNQQSIMRRKPMAYQINVGKKQDNRSERKIDNTFTNSTAVLSYRVKEQMTKFSRRVSGQFSPTKSNMSDYQKQYSSPSSPKLKSFSIDKMVSREHIHKIKNKVIEDERQFNNFKIQKHDLSKTCDFSKLTGRSLDFKLEHMNDLYHQSKKPYEYCYYKTNALKTKVGYKFENKEKQRYFFIKKRQIDFPATVMNPQKVDKGLKIASNFKGSNLRQDKISSFYLTSGKELPSQTDMRYMTNLTNFYKDKDGNMIEPKIDFTVKKLKQDLLARRKQYLKRPKNADFTRDQVCDTKYFKQLLHQHKRDKGNVFSYA